MGRLSGWASGQQWKMRTADGVLTGVGSGALTPRFLEDGVTIVQADGDTAGIVTVWVLPIASSLNLDAPITFVRTAGMDGITVSAPTVSPIVGGSVNISTTVGDSVTFVSNGVDAWYLVASYAA